MLALRLSKCRQLDAELCKNDCMARGVGRTDERGVHGTVLSGELLVYSQVLCNRL